MTDSIMRDIKQGGTGLRIVRVIPLDMDIPNSRRNVDVCSESFGNNVRWLLRNLGVHNSEHPQFETTVKKLKNLAKKIK